jgi:hypothetical protein
MVSAFEDARSEIDSRTHHGIAGDQVLAKIRPDLEALASPWRRVSDAPRRSSVLSCLANGRPVVSNEVDAFHPSERVVVEVEAGGGEQRRLP